MNKAMKICTFVLVSANLFQTAVFAQGSGSYRRQWDQMPAEQKADLQQRRAREQQNPYDVQGNVQSWEEYHERWNPSTVSQAEVRGRSAYRQHWDQMPAEQKADLQQRRAREQQNPYDVQGNVQSWEEYHDRWNPSMNSNR